tara:strand:+ start:207 stop:494 length:288 start_codon:yes stop_codon:yes gene_type:complete
MVPPLDTPNNEVCTAPEMPVTHISLLLITMPGEEAVAAVVALSTTVLPLLEATVFELEATVLLTVDDVTVSTASATDGVNIATRNMPVAVRISYR